jgi:CheY-like chemotaxis protein
MTSPTVLLVADAPDETEMYAHYLRHQGFCTVLATTAPEALRMATELRPSIIVTDMYLGRQGSGLELTRWLKRSSELQQVPVVMVTGYVFDSDRDAALSAGCDLFLTKPCTPDTLSDALRRLVAHS